MSAVTRILPPNESCTIDLIFSFISLRFGNAKAELHIAELSPWQHVFANKQVDLTSKYYLYDPALYSSENPTSTARKLLGEREKIIIGSIRNKLYLGSETAVGHLEPEHMLIMLQSNQVHLSNLSKKPITIRLNKRKQKQ